MRRPKTSKAIFVVTVGLSIAIISVVYVAYDPEKSLIEQSFLGYIIDLKMGRYASAALRVYPDDLLRLKDAIGHKLSTDSEFRKEVMEFFGSNDPSYILSQQRERYFVFLVERIIKRHPEVIETLGDGHIIGVEIQRKGDIGRVKSTIRVENKGKVKWKIMTINMVKYEGEWLTRL